MANRFESSISLAGLFSGEHKKPTLILLLTPFLLTAYKYYGTKPFYLDHLFPAFVFFDEPELTGAYYAFAASLVLLGLVPLFVIRVFFKEPLSAYGVQVGDASFGWKAALALTPIMIFASWLSSNRPEFLAEYPLYAGAGSSPSQFVVYALVYFFFYVGWEFCFRGFIQFGLRGTLGDWNAILVQTLASSLLHIGKPNGEIFGSIIGGVVWGIVVFRSRSLLYVLIIHWLLGVSLDFFIVYF